MSFCFQPCPSSSATRLRVLSLIDSATHSTARDLVSLLTCFHIGLYPNDKSVHPVEADEKKSKALDQFKKDFELLEGEGFKKLRLIVKGPLTPCSRSYSRPSADALRGVYRAQP
jgi:hypothetical protein